MSFSNGALLLTVCGLWQAAIGVSTTATFGLTRPGTGPTAAFLRARFAFTDDEVLRAERELRKIPRIDPATGRYCAADTTIAGDVCDSLQARFLLSNRDLRTLVTRQPSVLGYSIDSQITPSLAALQSRLSLSGPELKKVVMGLPQLLGLSYTCHTLPTLEALKSRLSLSEPELKKVVLWHPSALKQSFDKSNIELSLAALQSRFSLSAPELKKVVLGYPSLLDDGFEARLEPWLAALQSQLSLSDLELKMVVLRIN